MAGEYKEGAPALTLTYCLLAWIHTPSASAFFPFQGIVGAAAS